jgi:uncharacterized alpha-E superfamily protein
MLSRIAESLYWIGRYIERAEDTARITDIAYHFTLGMGLSENEAGRRRRHWDVLVAIAGEPNPFAARYGEPDEDTVPFYLTFDQENPDSIVSCVAKARELARALRHQIASEMWESLNTFYLELQRWQRTGISAPAINTYRFNRSVKEFSHLFQGVTDSTLPRDEGWQFLQAGKFLERAGKTARALNAKYHLLIADSPAFTGQGDLYDEPVPSDLRQWQALLRSFSGYEAYHKLYRTSVSPHSVVDLVLLNPVFPRSISFSIHEVDLALRRIAGALEIDADEDRQTWAIVTEAGRSVGRLRSSLEFVTTAEVLETGLRTYLADVEARCRTIGDQLHAEYFAPRILRAEEVVG